MNCTLREYTRFKDGVRTEEKRRAIYVNRKLVCSDGDISGPEWLVTRERWGRGEVYKPGIEKERINNIKMSKFFGPDVPPKYKKVEVEEVTQEDGSIKKVVKEKKRGKPSKYTEAEIRNIAQEIIASELTFAEWITKNKRESEKAAIYAKLKAFNITVKQGKRGRKKEKRG